MQRLLPLMRAVRFTKTGDLKHLQMEQVPKPEPKQGEVLVKVSATAITPSDLKNVLGYFPFTTVPRIPGRDFAGVVVEGPENLKNKEVWGTGNNGFSTDGSHAEYIAIPQEAVRIKPKNLSNEQAGGVGVAFVTAWRGLFTIARLAASESIIIMGSTGSVGSAAVQIAKWKGAKVIGTTRSDKDAATLHSRRIEGIVDLAKDNLKDRVMALTNGKGVDVVLDTVGGAMIENDLSILSPRGRVAFIAAPPGQIKVTFDALDFYRRELCLLGVNSLELTLKECGDILDQLKPGFESGALEPPHMTSLPFDKALDGYDQIYKGSKAKYVVLP